MTPKKTTTDTANMVDTLETNYGYGVYGVAYFNAPNVVASFRHRHPDLHISAIYSANEGAEGNTWTLMIVTDPKLTTMASVPISTIDSDRNPVMITNLRINDSGQLVPLVTKK